MTPVARIILVGCGVFAVWSAVLPTADWVICARGPRGQVVDGCKGPREAADKIVGGLLTTGLGLLIPTAREAQVVPVTVADLGTAPAQLPPASEPQLLHRRKPEDEEPAEEDGEGLPGTDGDDEDEDEEGLLDPVPWRAAAGLADEPFPARDPRG